MTHNAPKAADDFSRICVSVSCYAAQLGCGSVTASLGLCIPFYAAKFDVACTDLGILLTLSGMGYFVGVSIISKMLDPQDRWHLSVSRFVLLCASAFIAGTVAFTLFAAGSLLLVKILIFTQFIGIGGIDVLSTVALSEMWGQRVQPWMQARSAFYSFGGMIPPMVSAHGVATPLLFCGALCFSTALGGSYDIFISMLFGYDDGADSKDGGVENSRSTELSPLVRTRGRSRTRSRTRSLSPGGEFGTKVGGINISDALALRSTENQLESDELALLELIIESKHLDSDKSSGPTPVLDDLVTTVLDATPYCNITDDQRNDPAFEPLINKTLSYASVKIVDTIQKADGDGGSLTANQANFVDDIKESIVLVPRKARILLALMALLFYSCMTSFVGWLPSYFKLKEFSDGSDWTPMGTQMVSTFFFFMTAGCLASIPCSVYISISKMMRVHLALVSSGGVLLQVAIMLGPVPVPSLLLIGAALMGYGISAIFPLVVTIANDYGFTMDACATSGLLKGVAIGGICVPLILGYLMKMFGPNVLTLGLAWLGLGLVGTYMVIHVYLTAEADVVFSRSQRRIRSFSSGSQSIGSQGSVSAHHSARARLRSLSTTEYDFENGAGHA